MIEQLVKLAVGLGRGFLFRRLVRTRRDEPGESFALLEAAFGRMADRTETGEKPRPAAD